MRRLVVISGDNMLTQTGFPSNAMQTGQFKLTIGNPPCSCQIRSDVVAYSIGDSVFVWNAQAEETHILRAPATQAVTSLAFSSTRAEVLATTQEGSLLSWRCTTKGLISRLGWGVPRTADLGVRIESAVWAPALNALVAACIGRRPIVFRYAPVTALVSPDASVWQTQREQLMVAGHPPMKIGQPIERVRLSGIYVLVVCASQCEIFTVGPKGIEPFSRFAPGTLLVDIVGEKVFDCKDSALECRNHHNLQGTVKQTTNFGASVAQFLELN